MSAARMRPSAPRRPHAGPTICVCVLAAVTACDRAEPPTRPDTHAATAGSANGPRAERKLSRPHKRQVDASAAAADAGPLPDAGADAADAGDTATAAAASLVPPELSGDGGALLPQTEAEPSVDSAWFLAGTAALFRAIQNDDPATAEAFFFPLKAYEKVKDVADPARDYKTRLITHFRRDIHDYHKKLGARASEARFVGVELNKNTKRWMKPHTEGNKLGYFRVTHSTMRYAIGDAEKKLEVTSFISWRGEWYLVHLNGFE